MVFIRAPKISHIGEGVEVLATEGADPVAVRQGRAMAATFHPLSTDTRIHQAFLNLIRNLQVRNRVPKITLVIPSEVEEPAVPLRQHKSKVPHSRRTKK